ncbi:MAG: hypothetical protein ACM3JG_17495 [Thiohalocapsa sp.]
MMMMMMMMMMMTRHRVPYRLVMRMMSLCRLGEGRIGRQQARGHQQGDDEKLQSRADQISRAHSPQAIIGRH